MWCTLSEFRKRRTVQKATCSVDRRRPTRARRRDAESLIHAADRRRPAASANPRMTSSDADRIISAHSGRSGPTSNAKSNATTFRADGTTVHRPKATFQLPGTGRRRVHMQLNKSHEDGRSWAPDAGVLQPACTHD